MPPSNINPTGTTRRVVPSLLVLQLDSEKLHADGLSMVSLAEQIRPHCGTNAEVLETTTKRDLLDRLAALSQAKRKYGVVVAIGHSNETGIRIASDMFVSWDAFAGFLRPFEPRRLVLIACHAGRWTPAAILFRKLPRLRRIFACPVKASRDLAQMMLFMIPYVVHVKVPDDRCVLAAQLASLAITGGQVRHWQRNQDMNDPDGVMLDIASILVEPLAQEIPRMLRSVFK